MSLLPLENKVLKVFQLSANFREAVRVVTEKITSLSADQFLVKNLYVGVNATDLNITAGRYFKHDPIPYKFGIESLGEIVESNNANYRVGQFVVVKPKSLKAVLDNDDHISIIDEPKPEWLTILGTSGLTAAVGLSESARIKEGETVLITAAAGGLGHIAAQWAKLKGARVIALTSTDEKAEFLRAFQFERVINYRKEDLSRVLSAEYPSGIDVIWETVGTPLFEQLFEHLARKGRLVNVGATAGYKTVGYADIKIEDFLVKLHYGARTVIGFLVMDYKPVYSKYSDELKDYYSRGLLKVTCQLKGDQPFDKNLEGVYQAIEYLHGGHNIGKVIVQIA